MKKVIKTSPNDCKNKFVLLEIGGIKSTRIFIVKAAFQMHMDVKFMRKKKNKC